MSDPLVTDYFGSGASIVNSDTTPALAAGKEYLLVELDVLGLTGAARLDPDKILTKLVITAATYSEADTVNENGVELARPLKQGFATRKNLPAVAWGFSGTIYTEDVSSATLNVEQVI